MSDRPIVIRPTRALVGVLIWLIACAQLSMAQADGDSLLPLKFDTFVTTFKKAALQVSLREPFVLNSCLEGKGDKKTVCNYKLGEFMLLMAETKKGEKEIVELTMICTANDNVVNSTKCLQAYAAGISMTSPEMSAQTRAKIIHILIEGLSVGNSTAVTTDERKYTLQKSMGLWFHIRASDIEDS